MDKIDFLIQEVQSLKQQLASRASSSCKGFVKDLPGNKDRIFLNASSEDYLWFRVVEGKRAPIYDAAFHVKILQLYFEEVLQDVPGQEHKVPCWKTRIVVDNGEDVSEIEISRGKATDRSFFAAILGASPEQIQAPLYICPSRGETRSKVAFVSLHDNKGDRILCPPYKEINQAKLEESVIAKLAQVGIPSEYRPLEDKKEAEQQPAKPATTQNQPPTTVTQTLVPTAGTVPVRSVHAPAPAVSPPSQLSQADPQLMSAIAVLVDTCKASNIDLRQILQDLGIPLKRSQWTHAQYNQAIAEVQRQQRANRRQNYPVAQL